MATRSHRITIPDPVRYQGKLVRDFRILANLPDLIAHIRQIALRLDRNCRAAASARATRPGNAKCASHRPNNRLNLQYGGVSGRPVEPVELAPAMDHPGNGVGHYQDARIPRELSRLASRISLGIHFSGTQLPGKFWAFPWKFTGK